MNLLTPSSRAVTANRTVCIVLAALVVIVIGLIAAGVRSSSAVLALTLCLLGASWIIAATFIAILCSRPGLALQPPELYGAFTALRPFRIVFKLSNTNRRLPALFLTLTFDTSIGGQPLPSPAKFVGQLEPGATAEFEWEIIARRRGPVQLVGARVVSSFPGAIFTYECAFSYVGRVLIHPAIYQLRPQVRHLLAGRRQAVSRAHAVPAAMGDFIGAREYRPGDNPRDIDLYLSLRAPDYPYQLIVREFENPGDDDIWVVLDTAAAVEGDQLLLLYRHEVSISFSIALCQLLFKQKKRVRFRAVSGDGDELDIRIERASCLARLKTWLAGVNLATGSTEIMRILNDSERSSANVLFVSLRDAIIERQHRRLPVLTIPPDWQRALIGEVVEE